MNTRMPAFGATTLVVCAMAFSSLWAGPISEDQAGRLGQGWLWQCARPLGAVLGPRVESVETYHNEQGTALFHVISLEPQGYLVVAADDRIEPVVAFSSGRRFDASAENPLAALIWRDLGARLAAAQQAARAESALLPARRGGEMRAVRLRFRREQDKWRRLIALGEISATAAQARPNASALDSVDDPRVSPLLASRWGQTVCCHAPRKACFNYYTPQVVDEAGTWTVYYDREGDPNNFPTGCNATALAQLVRYYEHPAQVQPGSYLISVAWMSDGQLQTEDKQVVVRGGSGPGGAFDWTRMEMDPDCGTSLASCQEIGALCHDMSVIIQTTFSQGGSSAGLHDAQDALLGPLAYAHAVFARDTDGLGVAIVTMINPNLDAGRPVVLSLDGPGGGHAVLCDGYGYNSATLYHHLNMGWGGTDDAWYNLPVVESTYSFNVVAGCLYNVSPDAAGEIISGRVIDPNGVPAAAVQVSLIGTGGVVDTCSTDTRGIYAFAGCPSATAFTVQADAFGYASQQVLTGSSRDGYPTSGNRWAVDFPAGAAPGVVYVDGLATSGGNDGSSWQDAFIDLQDAIAWAMDPAHHVQEIWVAQGTYRPDRATGDRDQSFSLADGVALYGGFSGHEINRGQRDPAANVTVLSGDLLDNDTPVENAQDLAGHPSRSDNSRHVVHSKGNDRTAILDGFTIVGGYCYVSDPGAIRVEQCGAGMLIEGSAPIVSDCRFAFNAASHGGGLYIGNSSAHLSGCRVERNLASRGAALSHHESSSAVFEQCIFKGNAADAYGGVSHAQGDCSATFAACQFTNNEAGDLGGAVYAFDGTSVLRNCLVTGNQAVSGGGLFHSQAADAHVVSCTFSGNAATAYGGAIYVPDGGTLELRNSILWNDSAPDAAFAEIADEQGAVVDIRYNNIGPHDCRLAPTGIGNTNVSPRFVDPNADDYRLQPDSPCIGTGDPDYTLDPNETDLDGGPRLVDGRIDMGAYEHRSNGIVPDDWNGDGIVSIVGDVPPFVDCVYFGICPNDVDVIAVGDCNDDGILSIIGDVPCFVDCVYFGNCPQ